MFYMHWTSGDTKCHDTVHCCKSWRPLMNAMRHGSIMVPNCVVSAQKDIHPKAIFIMGLKTKVTFNALGKYFPLSGSLPPYL